MFYRIFLIFVIGILLLLLLRGIFNRKDTMEFPDKIIPPLGLPAIPWPEDNPYSKEKAELGRLLYFDKRLSSNDTVSCASCHSVSCGYSDCLALPIGINNRQGNRNSPTVINTAYATHLFWDGRAPSLEEQCKGPIANPNEMSGTQDMNQAHHQCSDRIRNIPGYRVLFQNAFKNEGVSINDIAKAVATFERTILSGNSPFDRYKAGDRKALTEEQIRGFEVFKKSGCNNCHAGYNFTDGRFLNIGIGMDKPDPDTGRYGITHDEKDWGAFKVPTLREVEHTGPYMHDGSLTTLEDVVDYYDMGGIKNKNLHPLMRPLHLSAEDKQALVSFMKSLNGEGWQQVKEPTQFPN